MKKNIIYMILCVTFIIYFGITEVNAQDKKFEIIKEPIMEYKYTLEEQKIKTTQFIWKTCMEELRKDGILSDEDIKNINSYLASKMKTERFEAPMKKFDKQKKALKPLTVEQMVSEKIITPEQGAKLRDKFSKYNFSNLDK